ncbi:MAG TPA: hypothetical protein VN714_18955 [Trebonia sp.]|nr:hypothetical protein [Trebonia sp.]
MTAQSWDELGTVAWGELRHNYGTAADVPGLLRACADRDAGLASEAMRKLDSAVFHQGGWICPAAPAVLPFLVKLAADPASGIRVEAVELTTNLAHEATRIPAKHVDPAWPPALHAATPSLLGLLDDGDATVRRAAVYLAGVGGFDAERALSALRARLATEPETGIRYDIIVSMAAAVAAKATNDANAASKESGRARDVQRELTAVAAPDIEDLQLRLAAVHGLAELGEPAERHLPLLIRAVTDPGTAQWGESAWFGPAAAGLVAGTGALLAEHPAAALEFSVGVSQRGDAAQRKAAIDRIAALTQEWRVVGDGLLPYLAGELTAAEPEVRFAAAYLLGGLGRDAAGYADQFAVLVDDDSPGEADLDDEGAVSDAVVWALARFGDTRAIANLRSRFTGSRLGFPLQSAFHGRRPLLPWLPLPHVSAVVRATDPQAELLDAVLGWMRAAGRHPAIAAQFCDIISNWGAQAAAAVPELRGVLDWAEPDGFPGPAAAKALGAIGPAASAASGDLQRHAAAGSHLAAWALWRVSGDASAATPLLASALGGETGRGTLLRYLPDFGPLAAPLEGRLRELLQERNDWARADAAQALWRITGDATAAAPVLAALTEPLSTGKYLPVALAAMRYLAGIPGAATLAPEVTETARAVLANPRRLASSGGWRAFTEDDEIRAAAAEFVNR